VILTNLHHLASAVNYGTQLEKLLKDIIILSEVALLAKRLANASDTASVPLGDGSQMYGILQASSQDSTGGNPVSTETKTTPGGKNQYDLFASNKRLEIMDMLGEWEEPELREEKDYVSDLHKECIFHKESRRCVSLFVLLKEQGYSSFIAEFSASSVTC
jgi:hypothetical protein